MKGLSAAVPSSAYLASGSRLAACAAAWCGVHCALTPLLAVAAPALALSEGIERIGWIGTALLGGVMLALGPARRSPAVILVFVGGATLWGASLAGWLEPLPETLTSASGGLILAGAMVRSARICHVDACDVCGDQGDSDRTEHADRLRQRFGLLARGSRRQREDDLDGTR